MILTLKELRAIIREEVERNMRWSAGFFSIGGAGHPRKGTEFPPQGLGDEEPQGEQEKEHEEEEEKWQQWAYRSDRERR